MIHTLCYYYFVLWYNSEANQNLHGHLFPQYQVEPSLTVPFLHKKHIDGFQSNYQHLSREYGRMEQAVLESTKRNVLFSLTSCASQTDKCLDTP